MKASAGWVVLLLLSACGRTERNSVDVVGAIPQAGAPAAAPDDTDPIDMDPINGGPNGGGPIEVSAQPRVLQMECPGRQERLTLELPCFVGNNLAGDPTAAGTHAVECSLLGDPGGAAISFTLPLSALPAHLGEPLPFPMEGSTAIPSRGTIVGAERFTGTLSGVITFTQVDLDSRAFVAGLEEGTIDWAGDAGSIFSCSTLDGPLWAVAGDFL